uniref:Uncharacterized protein n=1 Tax=Acrobeloides nanus TaxID=290746 RepID=A0A914C3N7_9BILA
MPNTREEAEYPISYARVVYRDYLLLEMELAVEYAPQNFYCYVLDKKSKATFKQQIRNLGKCFPNVFVSDNEFDTDSSGKEMNYAYMECMKILYEYQWNYLILLQNHDVITKTNYEVMQILQLFCGANDVRVQEPMMERFNESLDWTFEGLNLLKHPDKLKIPKIAMTFAKGQAPNSLSRPMVDFMLNELNLTKILAQLEGRYGIDELLMPMLQATEELDVPGGFTRKCIERGIAVNDITR